MKRFLLSVVLVTSLALTSCQFDDSDIWGKLDEYGESIRDHEQRISALEELCKQMNTNIEALQTLVDALEKRDYVTNVAPIREDGVVIGYTISFANSDTITIYHGKDGYTPQIGVMKDTDGIYYWTLDGEWLLDEKGDKIQANGVNGTNGVTPQLKIENDYWYVSYDNGATWVQLGKATGDDGIDGENGEDGDSIFKSVTQDDEYVYFNLADGTVITLPKHDKENIQFEDLQVKAICCKNWDTNNDGELSYAEAAAVTDIGDVFSENDKIIAFSEFKYFEGIVSLSNKAFYNCVNLWKIELPQYLTKFEEGTVNGEATNGFRGYGSFSGTSIANIVLPKELKNIGNGAFAYCDRLKSVKIPNGVSSIKSHAFRDCTSLTSITIPNSVTSIGSSAFSYCTSLTSVTIPDSVTKIRDWTFYNCRRLTSVTIPDSVTSIGSYAFRECASLTSITIPNSVTSIGNATFLNCTSLTSITIPDSVTSIGGSAFYNCSSLKAFYGKFASADNRCLVIDSVLNSFAPAGLTEYTIPNSVTSIEFYAFRECASLTSITIPDSVTSIGNMAFYNCSSLTSVYCKPTTPPTAGSGMFSNNASGRTIYVPLNSVPAYKAAEGWKDYADKIVGYDFQ